MTLASFVRALRCGRFALAGLMLIGASGPQASSHSEGASSDLVALDGQFGGAVSVIALDGRFGYVGVGPRVAVLDLGDPGYPVLAGWSDILPEATRDMALAGGRLVVTGIDDDVFVLAIDPATGIPRLEQRLSVPGGAYQVVGGEHHAYATTREGLHVLDVAPGGPARVVGTLALPAVRVLDDLNVVLREDRLYFGERDAGVGIVDVRSPEEPVVFGWNEDLGALRIAVGDAFVAAYTTEEDPGGAPDYALQILSLDPTTLLQPVGRIAIAPGESIGPMVARGRMLFVVGSGGLPAERGGYTDEIVVMSMDDLAQPEVIGRVGAPSPGGGRGFSWWRPRQMVLGGEWLYLAVNTGFAVDTTRSGVVAYRFGGLGSIEPAGDWLEERPGAVFRAESAGEYLLISEHLSGFLRLFRAVPDGGLEPLGLLPAVDGVQEVSASGRWLYYASMASSAQTLHAVDLIEPHRPTDVASLGLAGVRALLADGDRVYVGRDVPSELGATDRVVEVYGISAEDGLALLGGLANVCNSPITDMERAGTQLVLTCRTDGLIILDSADPTRLRRVAQVPIGRQAHAVAVDGHHAIVATRWPTPPEDLELVPLPQTGGVRIVDLRTLQEVGSHRTRLDRLVGGTLAEWDIAVVDGIALLTSAEKAVRLIDLREPRRPVEVQVLDLATAVGELAVAGRVVYVSGENAGVYRLRWLAGTSRPDEATLYLPLAFRRR